MGFHFTAVSQIKHVWGEKTPITNIYTTINMNKAVFKINTWKLLHRPNNLHYSQLNCFSPSVIALTEQQENWSLLKGHFSLETGRQSQRNGGAVDNRPPEGQSARRSLAGDPRPHSFHSVPVSAINAGGEKCATAFTHKPPHTHAHTHVSLSSSFCSIARPR